MTKQEQAKRFDAAIAALEEVIEKHYKFDINSWVYMPAEEAKHYASSPGPREGFCGTAACGLGAMALSTQCQALGLRVSISPNQPGKGIHGHVYYEPTNSSGSGAASDFLGITDDDVVQLVFAEAYEDNVFAEHGYEAYNQYGDFRSQLVTPQMFLERLQELRAKYIGDAE